MAARLVMPWVAATVARKNNRQQGLDKIRMVNGGSGGDGDLSPKRSDDPLGNNSEIGRKLKQYFDGLVSEDVPDRFSQLLSQLESVHPARSVEE